MKNGCFTLILIYFTAFVGFASCKDSAVNAGFEYPVSSANDIILDKFQDQPAEINRNKRLFNDAKDYARAIYGADVSLEIWQFENTEAAQNAWQQLIDEKKKESLDEFNKTTGKNRRFDFRASDGISGTIRNVNEWLLNITARRDNILDQFLKGIRISR